ncbi:TPA: hypothetical protein ENS27_18025, partial [bacterium]|nr:hypothetical protein [bacterium]
MQYPYYCSPEGTVIKMTDYARFRTIQTMLGGAELLAEAYRLSGKNCYARKVAVILNRFAEVYPDYPLHGPGMSWYQASLQGWMDYYFDPNPPHDSNSGRLHIILLEDMYYAALAMDAYDAIYDSGQLEQLGQEKQRDTKAFIEQNLIYPAAVLATESQIELGNYDAYQSVGLIKAGLTLAEPEFIHRGIKIYQGYLTNNFFPCGLWHESPVYHLMMLYHIHLIPDLLKGYSDPPGFVSEETGTRMRKLDFNKEYPFLSQVYTASLPLYYPNGMVCPLEDSVPWYGLDFDRMERVRAIAQSEFGAPYFPPPQDSYSLYKFKGSSESPEVQPILPPGQSELYPSYGHAVLNALQGEHQMRLHFDYGPYMGHHHYDCMNIVLYAEGDEVFSEAAYTYTQLRPYATGSYSHNLVIVDGIRQYGWGGSLESLALNLGEKPNYPVQFIAANAPDVYNIWDHHRDKSFGPLFKDRNVSRYARNLAVVPVNDEKAYIVDLFEVDGGKEHEFLLHGSRQNEVTVESDIDFQPTDILLGNDAYIRSLSNSYWEDNPRAIINLQSAEVNTPWTGEFVYKTDYDGMDDPFAEKCMKYRFALRNSNFRLRVHLIGDTPSTVLRGEDPSIRHSGELDSRVWERLTGCLIIRRTGEEKLKSKFLNIYEPYINTPYIKSVERLSLGDESNGAKVIINSEGKTLMDYVIFSNDPSKVIDIDKGIAFSGRFATFRFNNDTLDFVQIVDCATLNIP